MLLGSERNVKLAVRKVLQYAEILQLSGAGNRQARTGAQQLVLGVNKQTPVLRIKKCTTTGNAEPFGMLW
jgi:hypothetical protein